MDRKGIWLTTHRVKQFDDCAAEMRERGYSFTDQTLISWAITALMEKETGAAVTTPESNQKGTRNAKRFYT